MAVSDTALHSTSIDLTRPKNANVDSFHAEWFWRAWEKMSYLCIMKPKYVVYDDGFYQILDRIRAVPKIRNIKVSCMMHLDSVLTYQRSN